MADGQLENIIPVDIEQEMKKSYIDYAMSVIVGRALPDVRDGLKPVHRRILYAMHGIKNTPDKPYKKSARIVGEVLGKYHPHGDSSVYDAMVRMAQDFSIRYPLVDGQGNFGSVDGDSAAAMRYTEARMSHIAMEMMRDIEKETIDYTANFDDTLEEPSVLPAKIPNLLVNGSSGIAVGMATNIPPHHLGEVIDGIVKIIQDPEISFEVLMQCIKGPDFPTGGIILGKNGIEAAYQTGRGRIKVRARALIEKSDNGKNQIIVTELPYQVNKARLVENIALLVREKKLEGITDLRDESGRQGMRIVIEVRRGDNPEIVLNQLYKHTAMQTTFGVIMLALVDGQPRVLNLKEVIKHYLNHQKQIIVRRSEYELRKAKERAHILEGLRIALDHLDEVISLIRGSKTTDEARKGLIDKFGLSKLQAQAILDMRLQRLTGLERQKIENEYQELLKIISHLQAILADEKMVLDIVKGELLDIKKKYQDERRTTIVDREEEITIEDLIPDEEVIITLTKQGYIKRLSSGTYKSQHRGGRGISGMGVREEDLLDSMFVCNSHSYILFFTNKGKVYRLKAFEVPEASRQAKGTSAVNLISIDKDEEITALIPIKEFSKGSYLVMGTRKGIIKKTNLEGFVNVRSNGLIAINLQEDDELIGVRLTDGNQEVILGTCNGMAIRFSEKDIRSMGRNARGVKGISLNKGDIVVCMALIEDENDDLLVVTSKGFGKRTPLSEYRMQSRGGKGIKNIHLTDKTGVVIGIRTVRNDDEILLISEEGIIIRLEVAGISVIGRNTQGVTLMRLGEEDKVIGIAQIVGE